MSELTNGIELRALRVGEALNGGTPQVWDLTGPVPRPKGREFLFPEVSGAGGLSTCLTLMVTTELQELLTYIPHLYTRWKLEQRPGFNCACNKLRKPSAQSRDWHVVSRF